MHRQSAGQIWLNKKVQNSGRKRVRKATLFLLNDDGPAAVLPLRPAAALCVKMEKKANRKKTDDEAIKREQYYFIMEKQAGICRWPLVYLSSVQMQSKLQ